MKTVNVETSKVTIMVCVAMTTMVAIVMVMAMTTSEGDIGSPDAGQGDKHPNGDQVWSWCEMVAMVAGA